MRKLRGIQGGGYTSTTYMLAELKLCLHSLVHISFSIFLPADFFYVFALHKFYGGEKFQRLQEIGICGIRRLKKIPTYPFLFLDLVCDHRTSEKEINNSENSSVYELLRARRAHKSALISTNNIYLFCVAFVSPF